MRIRGVVIAIPIECAIVSTSIISQSLYAVTGNIIILHITLGGVFMKHLTVLTQLSMALSILTLVGCATAPDIECPTGCETAGVVLAPSVLAQPNPNPRKPEVSNCSFQQAQAKVKNPEKLQKWVLLFDFSSAELNEFEKIELEKAARTVTPTGHLKLVGYADGIDTNGTNLAIGNARAIAARNYLVQELEVPGSAIHIESRGEANPVASNQTAEGRRQNRRVEVLRYRCL